MIKIGIYLNSMPYTGGTFQYNQSILEALDNLNKTKYRVYAVYRKEIWENCLNKYDFENVYLQDVTIHGVRRLVLGILHRLSARCSFFDMAGYKKWYAKINPLSKKIDALKLDLMVCPSQDLISAQICTPCMNTIHDLMHRYESFPEVSEKKEYRFREFLYRNICKSAVSIFVDSHIGKQHVVECYGKRYRHKLYIMPFTPPGYLFAPFHEGAVISEEVPEKYIFYPAQFWKHKNHKNLIKALAVLRKRGLKAELVLAGTKYNGYEETVDLIRRKNLQGQVHILGYVSDDTMKYLYSNARAMIMPSFFGPTNIPPLEAMALGCPCAVSNVYAMPDEIGDAGLIFNPNHVNDIADVIEKLWTDDALCRNLAQRGKNQVKKFSQEQFNKRFQKAAEETLKRI